MPPFSNWIKQLDLITNCAAAVVFAELSRDFLSHGNSRQPPRLCNNDACAPSFITLDRVFENPVNNVTLLAQ